MWLGPCHRWTWQVLVRLAASRPPANVKVVGDGNFHCTQLKTVSHSLVCPSLTHNPAGIFYSDAERQTAEEVVHRMVERAIEMEGTITGEHGIGLVKRDYLPHELGQDTVDAMRKVSAVIVQGRKES